MDKCFEWKGARANGYGQKLHNGKEAGKRNSEMKRTAEKPIIANNAERKDKLRQSMASGQLSNPYESDKHKAAQEWLRKHGIETVKALRISNGQ